MAAFKELQAIEKHLQELGEKFQAHQKEMQKTGRAREQLETQRQENSMVKEELDLVEDDTNVFKMIGPVLVKQDLSEARITVSKRLEYINKEISRVEKQLSEGQSKAGKLHENIQKIQARHKDLQMAMMQQQQQQR